MLQDFARPIFEQHSVRKSRNLWRHIRPLGWVATGMLVLLLAVTRVDVNAHIDSNAAEEWLESVAIIPHLGIKSQTTELKSGDTATIALLRLGLDRSQVEGVLKASKSAYSLSKIRAGKVMWRRDEDDGMHLFYPIDKEELLHLTQFDGLWVAKVETRVHQTRLMQVQGNISSSLFYDAARAGLADRTVMNMVDIFSWDIDFAHDVRAGDSFTLLLEEGFDESGESLGQRILAASFHNRDREIQAVRYLSNGKSNYYTPDGKNLRKAYLRSPVKYSRISSRYSSARKHPVLGYTRAHRGVDYAAPAGTPIRAVGEGKVVFSGWKGGYGRLVQIRHANSAHQTAYAHMSRFGKGIRVGKYIRQGQIIGYVGSSGLTTGSHLHYEFRVGGNTVNPLNMRFPPGKPIAKNEMAQFKSFSRGYFQQLERTPQMAWL